MAGQTNNLFSNNCEQDSNPRRGQVNDAKVMTVGTKRGEFPDGAATVLVLDHFQHTREYYEQRVPQECNLLFVRDTMTAEQAIRENPAIGVVIAQGLSRKATHWMVDAIDPTGLDGELVLLAWLVEQERKGEPISDWLDSHEHTLVFLKFLQQQSFSGLVQVVSRTLKSYQVSEMLELKNLRAQFMDKHAFFSGAFTSKMNGLWERITQYERWECRTGRKLGLSTLAGQEFDRLLAQVVYPHPAEDELYDNWEEAASSWRGFSFEKPEAVAAEMAVTWLEELKVEIASGDIRAIYDRAVMLPEDRLTCECLEPLLGEPYMADYRWMHHFHWLHELFNLAVWEILDMAGLMQWMRLELEFELAAKHAELEGFGRHVRIDDARQRHSFFRPEGPSEQWIGWRASYRV